MALAVAKWMMLCTAARPTTSTEQEGVACGGQGEHVVERLPRRERWRRSIPIRYDYQPTRQHICYRVDELARLLLSTGHSSPVRGRVARIAVPRALIAVSVTVPAVIVAVPTVVPTVIVPSRRRSTVSTIIISPVVPRIAPRRRRARVVRVSSLAGRRTRHRGIPSAPRGWRAAVGAVIAAAIAATGWRGPRIGRRPPSAIAAAWRRRPRHGRRVASTVRAALARGRARPRARRLRFAVRARGIAVRRRIAVRAGVAVRRAVVAGGSQRGLTLRHNELRCILQRKRSEPRFRHCA